MVVAVVEVLRLALPLLHRLLFRLRLLHPSVVPPLLNSSPPPGTPHLWCLTFPRVRTRFRSDRLVAGAESFLGLLQQLTQFTLQGSQV